jgi:multidrug resistance protein, MATE family
LFAGATLMMGVLGTSALAAHQIALQIAAVVFMVPLGISLAGTVRVGHAVGRSDSPGTRRAGHAAILIGAFFQATMAIVVIATRDKIPYLFLGDEATPATVSLAATLLFIGALFFIADGMQSVASGALRGLNDTFIPFLFSFVGFWLVGFSCAYALAFPLGYGAPGIWTGLLTGLIAYAAMLIWRFELLTRRGYLPAPDKTASI